MVHVIRLVSCLWLWFSVCLPLWWIRIRGLWKLPDGRDWLRGKLVPVLMGGAMLSKFLIHFSVDGRAMFLLCCLTWGQTVLQRPNSYPSPSEGRQTENYNHRILTNLITWTTALFNSMKLWAMPCRATQDGWVMVESSDKTWSTGGGNDKPLQYSCLENPETVWKGKKIVHWKMNSPGRLGAELESVHELLIAKFRLKLKKVGKTARPFRYDLNQIPQSYIVEVRNRFKGLHLIIRVPDELWMKVHDIVEETGSKIIPKKKKCKKQSVCLRRPNK